jgi:hypothetical protein
MINILAVPRAAPSKHNDGKAPFIGNSLNNPANY